MELLKKFTQFPLCAHSNVKLDHGVLAAGFPMPKSCSSQLKRFVELVVLSSMHSETVLPMRGTPTHRS